MVKSYKRYKANLAKNVHKEELRVVESKPIKSVGILTYWFTKVGPRVISWHVVDNIVLLIILIIFLASRRSPPLDVSPTILALLQAVTRNVSLHVDWQVYRNVMSNISQHRMRHSSLRCVSLFRSCVDVFAVTLALCGHVITESARSHAFFAAAALLCGSATIHHFSLGFAIRRDAVLLKKEMRSAPREKRTKIIAIVYSRFVRDFGTSLCSLSVLLVVSIMWFKLKHHVDERAQFFLKFAFLQMNAFLRVNELFQMEWHHRIIRNCISMTCKRRQTTLGQGVQPSKDSIGKADKKQTDLAADTTLIHVKQAEREEETQDGKNTGHD